MLPHALVFVVKCASTDSINVIIHGEIRRHRNTSNNRYDDTRIIFDENFAIGSWSYTLFKHYNIREKFYTEGERQFGRELNPIYHGHSCYVYGKND